MTQFLAHAQRAELLLCPIVAKSHWTLLALQRVGSSGRRVGAGAKHDAEVAGCSKYALFTVGCIECSALKAHNYQARHDAEDSCIDPLRLDPLPLPGWWDTRYYDSLSEGTQVGADMARALLDLLQPLNAVNIQTAEELRGTAPFHGRG